MANYINTTTGNWPISETQIRQSFPQTSFPALFVPPDEYKVIFPAPAPTPTNPVIQVAREITPVLTIKGHYEQAYEVVDRFQDYTDEEGITHIKEELEMAAIAADAAQKLAALVKSVTEQTQARLDAFASTRNYDGILSACTYATSVIPQFQSEGQYCVTARDTTWAALYTIMAEVQAGTRPVPAGFADIEPLLPELVWP